MTELPSPLQGDAKKKHTEHAEHNNIFCYFSAYFFLMWSSRER